MTKIWPMTIVAFLLILGAVIVSCTPSPPSRPPAARPPSNREPAFYFSTPEAISVCESLDSTTKYAAETLPQLIENRLDVNVQGKFGMSLLTWAFYRDDLVAFRMFLQAGADPNIQFSEPFELHLLGPVNSGETVSELAARNGLYDYTLECLPYLHEINQPGKQGNRLLHALASAKSAEARRLLEQLVKRKDIELDVVNIHGETPLDLALREKNYEYVVWLLKAGAHISACYHGANDFRARLRTQYGYARHDLDHEQLKQLDAIKELILTGDPVIDRY